ncbi:acetyltransferase [Caballeronia udeis]|uniref:Acetyltransferase n=1 Tax=Caballeronia udeis TaxID=1232866 RepID=A0A158JP14_9BURK|nr:GNAT family N-acetyltransferase [Caballeronia udeis]SAL70612.1 acetyltransferase [Caballeronia udeis]
MQPVIRRYEAADLDAVMSVFLRSVRDVASRDYDAGQIASWAQADRDVWARRRLDRPTWVALIDDVIAGFTDLESNGHIDMLFVDPACLRRGVASALLDTVENAARAQRLAILHTDASITARPFFETRGFQVIRSQAVVLRGQRLTNFRMEKRLRAV